MKTFLPLLLTLLLPIVGSAANDRQLTGSYLDYLRLSSEPSAPRTGYLRAYIGADGKLYGKNSAGVVSELGGGGGGTSFTTQAPLAYDSLSQILSLPAATAIADGFMPAAKFAQVDSNTTRLQAEEAATSAQSTINADQAATNASVASSLSNHNGRLNTLEAAPQNGISQLTGDVAATGPGSAAATIQPNAVSTAKIADGAVTEAKHADNSISLAKMQTASVSGDKLTVGAVDLASTKVTGVAPVVKGGTGTGTLPAAGQVLQSDGTGYNASYRSGPDTLLNVTFFAGTATNQLVIGAYQNSGSDFSASSPGVVSFRFNSAGVPVTNTRTITAPLAYTFPAGTTLGRVGGTNEFYAYLVDTGSGVALAASAKLFDEAYLQNVVQASATSTDPAVLYSSAASGSYPIRLLGKFTSTVATTASTWTTGIQFGSATAKNQQAAQISFGNTETKSYTPTIAGFGTVTSPECFWSRSTDQMNFDCKYTTGTLQAGVPASISLPAGFSIAAIPSIRAVGECSISATGGTGSTPVSATYSLLASPSASALNMGYRDVNFGALQVRNGSDFLPGVISCKGRFPIAQFQGQLSATLITKDPVTSISALATRVTSFSSPCKPGEYRSYNRNANAYTYTEAAPTTLPTAADGFFVQGVNFTTAGAMNRYEVCTGQGKFAEMKLWANAARTNSVDYAHLYYGTATEQGMIVTTDRTAGITYIDAGSNANGITTRTLGLYQAPGGTNLGANSGYFDIFAHDNPLAAGLTETADAINLDTLAGYGSTNTKVPYFTNASVQGSAMSLVNNGTSGALIKINTRGAYCTNFGIQSPISGGTTAAIVVNGTGSYTQGAGALSTSVRKAYGETAAVSGNAPTANPGYCGIFNKDDVINPQTDGAVPYSAARASFSIVKAPSPLETVGAAGGAAPTTLSAKINNSNGVSGSCAVSSAFPSSTWITSNGIGSTGACSFTMSGWASEPMCQVQSYGLNTGSTTAFMTSVSAISSTAITVQHRYQNGATTGLAGDALSITCTGQKSN